jgi:hypothetical protein
VIGDDLASGYGVEGANETCVYSYQTQNSDLGYPALLAKDLGADVHVVAADGRGLIRNYSGAGPAMDVLAWQSLVDGDRAWAALSYQPQVIVVGLGTADFTQSDPGAAFDEAYFLLLRKLRVAYPDAVIMASIGGALWGKRYLAARDSIAEAVEAVRKTGDAKVRFTEFKLTAGPGRYGCDYHPGKLAQAEMARALKAEIEVALGWKPVAGAPPRS